MTHAGLPDSRRPTHRAGWDYYLGRLRLVLRGMEPGPDTFAGPPAELKED
ncbi:hypothetical protein N6H14_09980 [Paenibacillus sp. CC-CFT747]|nr:hypothetical protein N6H14_09980 [Paenibacillus sp. CC-CFT747]